VQLSKEVVVAIEAAIQMADPSEASKRAHSTTSNNNNLVQNRVLLLMVELIIIKIPLTNNKMQMVMLLNQSSSSVGVREEAVGVTSTKAVVGTSVKAGEVAV
jgi:hypothetical protein